jgi:hypothetical protein
MLIFTEYIVSFTEISDTVHRITIALGAISA